MFFCVAQNVLRKAKESIEMITMHPGEYISEMFMADRGLTTTELAKKLDVSIPAVSRLLNQKADVSPDMAVRLENVFQRSAESWMAMQASYSLAKARERLTSTEGVPA